VPNLVLLSQSTQFLLILLGLSLTMNKLLHKLLTKYKPKPVTVL